MGERNPGRRRPTRRNPATDTNTGQVTFNAARFDEVIDPEGRMTQVEKATLLGVPESVMSLVVRGRRQPNTAFIKAVRRVVPARYPIEQFFDLGTPLDEAA